MIRLSRFFCWFLAGLALSLTPAQSAEPIQPAPAESNQLRPEKYRRGSFADDEALVTHITERLLTMISAMREIDPEIKIIIDAVMWEKNHENWIRPILQKPQVREAADFATVHLYRPWSVKGFEKASPSVEADRLSPEDLWYY